MLDLKGSGDAAVMVYTSSRPSDAAQSYNLAAHIRLTGERPRFIMYIVLARVAWIDLYSASGIALAVKIEVVIVRRDWSRMRAKPRGRDGSREDMSLGS